MARPDHSRTLRGGFWLRVVGMVFLVVVLSRLVDVRAVAQTVVRIPAALLGLAIGVTIVRLFLMGWRWKVVLDDPDVPLSPWTWFRAMMASSFFNLFMPGALGGDIARSVVAYRLAERKRGRLALSVWVDRIVGFLSVGIMGLVACFLAWGIPGTPLYVALTLLIVAMSIGLLSTVGSSKPSRFASWLRGGRRLPQRIAAAFEVLSTYILHTRALLFALSLCIPIHACSIGLTVLLARNLALPVSVASLAAVTAITWVAAALPISWSGLGVRELSFVYLLSFHGVSPEAATALSLQLFSVQVATGALGAIFTLGWRKSARPQTQT